MASVFSQIQSTRIKAGRDEVYVATMPLRATKGPPQLLMSAAYSLNLWDLQHLFVIIKPSSPTLSETIAFDFQPEDPENIYVALAALSGMAVPGVVRERKLTRLPRNKLWSIGYSKEGEDGVEAAHEFNKTWHTDLRIGYHDCRDYTNGLVEYLTGKKLVLNWLRRKISREV